MRTDRMFMFLSAPEMNNSRDGLRQDEYKRAKGDFEELLAALTPRVRTADPAVAALPVDKIAYRLSRDTRFSRDKSPYTPAFRAHFGPAGKLPVPCGYFLSIRPGDRSFLGGGLCRADLGDAPFRIRAAIDRQGGALSNRDGNGAAAAGEKLSACPWVSRTTAERVSQAQAMVCQYPLPDRIAFAGCADPGHPPRLRAPAPAERIPEPGAFRLSVADSLGLSRRLRKRFDSGPNRVEKRQRRLARAKEGRGGHAKTGCADGQGEADRRRGGRFADKGAGRKKRV